MSRQQIVYLIRFIIGRRSTMETEGLRDRARNAVIMDDSRVYTHFRILCESQRT